MLFADVRGSTALAEQMSTAAFTALMNRFYTVVTKVLTKANGFVDKLVGDEVIGLFFPGFVGPDHADVAVQTGRELLRATGHSGSGSPWLPVGVGIHTGTAFAGAVGTAGGITDFTALGDAVNTAARLVSKAEQGEIVMSESTYTAADLQWSNLEQRRLELKGKEEPVEARVLRIGSS